MATDNELVAEAVEALRPAVLSTALTPAGMALVSGMVLDMTIAIAPRVAAVFDGLTPESAEEASMQRAIQLWAEAVSLLAMPEPSL